MNGAPIPTLEVNVLRTLDLAEPLPGGSAFVSAASGLTVVDGHYVVAADDEHHIGLFACHGGRAGHTRRVVDDDLPTDPGARKRRKPDFEALTLIPATPALPNGALLVVGSGSTSRREIAVAIELDGDGALTDRVHRRPLAPLYTPWRRVCAELNVEAAFVLGADLVMVSRGHGAAPDNHVARFGLASLASWLDGVSTAPIAPHTVTSLRLGDVDGVPFSITDGAAHPTAGWIFSAVAEDTRDSYNDGVLVGAGVGTVTDGDVVSSFARLGLQAKVEGISAASGGSGQTVLTMVTDADDPTVAASLLTVTLPAA